MDGFGTFITNLFNPLIEAANGFWSSVVMPFWNAVSGWFATNFAGVSSFGDFCLRVFKIRYTLRVASFGLMLILLLISIPVAMIGRKKRQRRRRDS